MNREIKFRGQRVDTKEWVYGYYFKTPLTYEGSEIAAKDGWNFMSDGKVRHCISDRGITYEVISETVGQFIGYNDEDKCEVYEDDVIRYMTEDGEVYHAVIKFKADDTTENTPFLSGFTVEVIKCVTDEYEKEIEANEAIELKVIGNIHNNPVKEGI